MYQAVQVVPVIVEVFEYGLDLAVAFNVTGYNDFGATFCGKLFNAAFETIILVGECQFSPFSLHGLGDTVGNGTIAGYADDQGALAF